MQKTRSYWLAVAAASVMGAFVASACVVTTDDDDSSGGASGSNTAGSGTAGSGTAGSGTAGSGTAGSGTAGGDTGGTGGQSFQCDPAEGGPVGKPNECKPEETDDDCYKCFQTSCCEEFKTCFAYEPGNQCGWGGPAMVNGMPNENGEIGCVQECLKKAVEISGVAPTDEEVGTCANECATTLSNGATKECGPVIGNQTSDAVACLREKCSLGCFGAAE